MCAHEPKVPASPSRPRRRRLAAPFGWAWAATTTAQAWSPTGPRHSVGPRSKTAKRNRSDFLSADERTRAGARLNQCRRSHPRPTSSPPPPMALLPAAAAGAAAPAMTFAAKPCGLRRASAPPAAALRLGPLFWPWEKVQQPSLFQYCTIHAGAVILIAFGTRVDTRHLLPCWSPVGVTDTVALTAENSIRVTTTSTTVLVQCSV